MHILDILHETYTSLSANKVRSGLTILGIVIGISSVIAMVSIGQGAKSSIQASIEGLGSNLLTIIPGVIQPGRGIVSSGRGSAQTLKEEDLAILENIEGVLAISPESSRRFQISAGTGNNTNTTVTGVLASYPNVKSVTVANGNFLSESDTRSYGRQAVLGATVAKDLFGEDDPLGQTIRINGSTFRVVGILAVKGGYGFSGPDDTIFVPLPTMQKILAGVDYLSTVSISVASKDQINTVKEAVTSALLTKHRIADPDFSIISLDDMLSTLSQVISTFTIFLASVAGISLVVGGIGIMNMMLTTVTERTREIGLRKAIGAKRRDINLQFLIEAVALTFIGGFMGIVLGWLISFGVNYSGLVKTQVSWPSVLLAFGVSAGIGIIFGYYPAKWAASLNPIDALRYE
jgi:ABC-type antimicrobial peptide transport system permease subunit